ncbi:MAG: SIS domain-containing protein [Chloroflexi bacterium]|nr:SIS domain-containing protein [Chloroflexota bacterium]
MSDQQPSSLNWQCAMDAEPSAVKTLYEDMLKHKPLNGLAPALAQAYLALAYMYERGGTLFICGNGGSMADAIHISGELLKSFARARPLPHEFERRLLLEPDGSALAASLQTGLRAHVLGLNPALLSAASNDLPLPGVGYAQELLALARPGDVLLGISTSGKARNVHLAVSVARAQEMTTIGLTGAAPNPLADRVDIPIAVPERETFRAQELHEALYHQLCLMLEARFF